MLLLRLSHRRGQLDDALQEMQDEAHEAVPDDDVQQLRACNDHERLPQPARIRRGRRADGQICGLVVAEGGGRGWRQRVAAEGGGRKRGSDSQAEKCKHAKIQGIQVCFGFFVSRPSLLGNDQRQRIV